MGVAVTMTAHDIARVWGAPVDRVTRWCQLQLLPATKTACGDWHIDPSARPVWRDGPSMLALFGEFRPVSAAFACDVEAASASEPKSLSPCAYSSLRRWV